MTLIKDKTSVATRTYDTILNTCARRCLQCTNLFLKLHVQRVQMLRLSYIHSDMYYYIKVVLYNCIIKVGGGGGGGGGNASLYSKSAGAIASSAPVLPTPPFTIIINLMLH